MKQRVGQLVGGGDRGHALARHLPLALACRILRRHAELVGLKSNFTILDTDDQLRLLRQIIQAENIDEKRWPPRLLAGLIDRWKNRALAPERVPSAEGERLRPPRRRALRRVPGAAADAERLRLRRPAAARRHHPAGQPGRAGEVPALVPLHPRRRVPGHQRRPVPVAAAARRRRTQHLLRRRRRPVDLRLARRRGRQHPALREGLPRRQGDPARAELPLDPAHPRRRLRRDRRQREPARQDPVDRRPPRARRSG